MVIGMLLTHFTEDVSGVLVADRPVTEPSASVGKYFVAKALPSEMQVLKADDCNKMVDTEHDKM